MPGKEFMKIQAARTLGALSDSEAHQEIRRLTILLNDMAEYLYSHPDASTVAEDAAEIEAQIRDLETNN